VRSPTRRTLLAQASQDLGQHELLKLIPAVWSGSRAYRATFPVEKLNEAWTAEVGPNQLHRVHSEVVVAVSLPSCSILTHLYLTCSTVHWTGPRE